MGRARITVFIQSSTQRTRILPPCEAYGTHLLVHILNQYVHHPVYRGWLPIQLLSHLRERNKMSWISGDVISQLWSDDWHAVHFSRKENFCSDKDSSTSSFITFSDMRTILQVRSSSVGPVSSGRTRFFGCW